MTGVLVAPRPRRWAPYRAILGARFRVLLQYRMAAIAGLWTQVFFGLVLIMVYEAFYRSSAVAASPMALPHVVSYVWLGQALFAMMPWSVDPEVRAMVRSGAVAYELCRPVELYSLWYVRALAHRTAPALLRVVPMVLVAMIALPLLGFDEWQLAPPPTLAAAAGFAVCLAGALALSCAISALLNISLLWTLGADGIVVLMAIGGSLLAGLLIPLPLLPDWAQPVLRWSPFGGLFDLPFRIYTGSIPLDGLAFVLARQAGWTAILVGLGRWMIGRGMRRLAVQGG